MRLFYLQRHVDVSGISGTGVVAEGVEFTDGQCAISWQSGMPSICMRNSLDEVKAIHGHGDCTTVSLVSPFIRPHSLHNPFWLGHTENKHGLSGMGIVAEACRFTNGWVVMRWLVPPYGVEVFTSYDHWVKVHASQDHTYVKTYLPLVFPVEGALDWAFSEHKWYREFMEGAWYFIIPPSFSYGFWSRVALDPERVYAFELYYSNTHRVI